MKKMKKAKNGLLILLSSILVFMMAVSCVDIVNNSYLRIESPNGGEETSVLVPYTDRVSNTYEDSELFSNLLRNEVNDVTRLCVIRNQMETAGKYDANKKIDVSEFANRRNSVVTKSGINYKLDDLIKWGNYGFDYQTVTGNNRQLEAYFEYLKGDFKKTIKESEVYHLDGFTDYENLLYVLEEPDSDAVYNFDILIPRYKSSDGKDIIDFADNWVEYAMISNYICESANELFSNYSEYESLKSKYETGSSNIVYCYQMDDNGKAARYSNMGAATSTMSNDDISKMITEMNRYICFNPEKLQLATNCKRINTVFMKQSIDNYSYAFEDNSRIWIGIDTSYQASDILKQGKLRYSEGDTKFPVDIAALLISAVLYVFLIVIMTVRTGVAVITDEEGNKKKEIINDKIDRIPIELFVCIIGVLFMIVMGGVAAVLSDGFFTGDIPLGATFAIFGCSAFAINLIFVPLYLVFVRKIKGKLIWETSLVKKLVSVARVVVLDVMDNGNVVVRCFLPYLIFLVANLVLVLIDKAGRGILIAFILDMLVGVYLYNECKGRENIIRDISRISSGDINHKSDTKGMHGDNLALASAVNNIGEGIKNAVETSMKDEKMKADLITNVSHDIKTPLTSIINYVDLIKRENIDNEKVREYVEILDKKSQRLKSLTDDLVEASKISSGAVVYNFERINFALLINQSVGEFSEKFEEKGLSIITKVPENAVFVKADSRGMYRVIENLYNNIFKYALENTRVYADITCAEGTVTLSLKNISAEPLNISSEELMERFTRGDVSRKTEGSGLGLSIAKNLTEAMGGRFNLELDGDLFKAMITFDTID